MFSILEFDGKKIIIKQMLLFSLSKKKTLNEYLCVFLME